MTMMASMIEEPAAGRWVKTSKPHNGGSRRRRFLGMAACFVVSGLMHELIYW